ncbi:hypothetical protein HK096_003986 [Nowakowskiella sp. JEL0078]|nr:hypothetical protein HK096_003986 [Nowakowskiella sp. JEL0078]
MSSRLPIPFLTHFFITAGWCKLKSVESNSESLALGIIRGMTPKNSQLSSINLSATIQNFHLSELDSSDFRSAYHQVCDWLYGWNVTDVTGYSTEFSENGNSSADSNGANNSVLIDGELIVEHHYQMNRIPRDIDMSMETEQIECDRILKTFETLFAVSRRNLKKMYLDVEEMMPRLGQGISIMKNNHDGSTGINNSNNSKKKYDDEDDDETKSDVQKNTQSKVDIEQIWAKKDENMKSTPKIEQNQEKSTQIEENFNFSQDSLLNTDLLDLSRNKGDGVVVRSKKDAQDRQQSFDLKISKDLQIETKNENESIERQTDKEPDIPAIRVNSNTIPETSQTAFNFFSRNGLVIPDQEESLLALHRDINLLYKHIDRCTEYTLVNLSCAITVLSFAQLLQKSEIFNKFTVQIHEISNDFVSNTLKTLWDVLNKELPSEISLADIRNPSTLYSQIQAIIQRRTELTGRKPRLRISKIHLKLGLLHELLSSTDIFLFPQFAWAHKEGCKSLQYSGFSPSIWLTAGYDSIIRIHDLSVTPMTGGAIPNQPGGGVTRSCLAQYIGHRSIVTDARFVKDDTHIVSASFDRTIKIWNAQNAGCLKTLTGHSDAVMSLDVSPDSRVIASGGMDGTVRVWDFASGECVSVLKKHARWVKVVRFTWDGKQLLTGGLDRKVYLWETKLLMNAKNVTHTRCIEGHTDHVLDITTAKPNILVSTSRDSTVRLFDYSTGHELHVIDLAPSWACTVTFAEGGEYFATGSFDNTVLIFKTKSAEKLRQIRIFNLGIMCVRFPKDLSFIVVGTTEGFLQRIPL